MADRSEELRRYKSEMERRALRETTIDKRLSVLVRCERALNHPLVDATTDELRDWLDNHKLNPKTRYSYISHLASFWQWAMTEELVTRNPTLRLTRPKLRRSLPRPVAKTDLATLVQQAPTHEIRAMVILAGYCGLRCMEIANLDAGDIMAHLEPPVVVVQHGKGDRPRVVPMSQTVIDALYMHGVRAYGPVFRDENGNRYQPWKVSHILRDHMHASGVTASAHQLRHAYGTEVYRKSHDLRLTQELMGHSSPATTAGYTAWAQDRAAAVVDTLFT